MIKRRPFRGCWKPRPIFRTALWCYLEMAFAHLAAWAVSHCSVPPVAWPLSMEFTPPVTSSLHPWWPSSDPSSPCSSVGSCTGNVNSCHKLVPPCSVGEALWSSHLCILPPFLPLVATLPCSFTPTPGPSTQRPCWSGLELQVTATLLTSDPWVVKGQTDRPTWDR